MRLSFIGLLAANVLVWGLCLPARTFAYASLSGLNGSEYSTVCPPRPAEPSEGASVTEVDLITIAQQQADACYRREQLAQQQHKDLEAIAIDLTKTLKTTIEGEPTIKIGNWESAPASSTVELSAPAKAQIDGDAGALHADAWFIVGAMLAIAAALALYFEIRPRR